MRVKCLAQGKIALPRPEIAPSAGYSLLGFLWNKYERNKTGEEDKSEGGGEEEEGKKEGKS